MSGRIWLLWPAAAPCLAWAPEAHGQVRVPANVVLSDPTDRCVVATYRLTASPDRAAEDVHCWFPVPQDEPRQRVHELRFQPKPAELLTDEHGRRLAHFHVPRIAKGRHCIVRWMARVTTCRTKTYLDKPPGPGRVKLDAAKRRLYLLDKPPYGIDSAFIREAAAAIGPADMSASRAVQAICDYINKSVRYEMAAGWDNAETVLRRGSGSCSELAYAFIALCRARGIPARYVGGTTWPRHGRCSFDDANHRWTEAFLDKIGWVDIDFRLRGYAGRNHYMMSPYRLVLGHGDGDDRGPLRWAYTAKVHGKVKPRANREFFWCEPVPAKVFDEVAGIASRTKLSERSSAAGAVRALGTIGRPLCVPFLADLLWSDDPLPRRQAVEAICRIDEMAARRYRYNERENAETWRAFCAELDRPPAGAAPGKPGWVDLFDGRRICARLAKRGPFQPTTAGGEPWLASGGRRGTTLFDHRTPDRCVIELLFRHTGVGRAGLLFGHVGPGRSVRLPFHVPDEPHVRHNHIAGLRCPRGRYGVAPEKLHRAVVVADAHRARFDLDGRTVFTAMGRLLGPGHVGLTVWGRETDMQVKRLRVFDGPEARLIESDPGGRKPPSTRAAPHGDLLDGAVLVLTFDKPTIVQRLGRTYARDLSGTGRHGLLHGGHLVPGKAGQAIRLGEGRDRVEILPSRGLRLRSALTAAAWVRTSSRRGGILCQHASRRDGCFVFGLVEEGRFRFGGSNAPRDSRGVADGAWHHLVGVYGAEANRVAHYVDGARVADFPAAGALPYRDLPIVLGETARASWHFAGAIDEVALFDRALSREEVRALYRAGRRGESLAEESKGVRKAS